MKKIIALLLALVMAFAMVACGDTPAESPSPSAPQPSEPSKPVESEPAAPTMGDPVDRAEYNIPVQYTKVKIFVGTYGFGDAELVAAMNDDETAFYIQFVCFDEAQILEGTVSNGICMVTYDLTGFVSGDAQLMYDDALASEELWCPLVGEAAPAMGDSVDRNEYSIPDTYTKVKTFIGTYGFGDAEIIYAMNDTEDAFYVQFVCFDEAQILEGTVSNGICIVSFDLTGFVSGDAQLFYDDCLSSSELWHPLTGTLVDPVSRTEYSIPEQYTKVKIFIGTYGFGDAEIIYAMNDTEDAFYVQFVCFDEAQILEGTVANGICMVTYDLTGFVSGDAQLFYDDCLSSENPWAPLQ